MNKMKFYDICTATAGNNAELESDVAARLTHETLQMVQDMDREKQENISSGDSTRDMDKMRYKYDYGYRKGRSQIKRIGVGQSSTLPRDAKTEIRSQNDNSTLGDHRMRYKDVADQPSQSQNSDITVSHNNYITSKTGDNPGRSSDKYISKEMEDLLTIYDSRGDVQSYTPRGITQEKDSASAMNSGIESAFDAHENSLSISSNTSQNRSSDNKSEQSRKFGSTRSLSRSLPDVASSVISTPKFYRKYSQKVIGHGTDEEEEDDDQKPTWKAKQRPHDVHLYNIQKEVQQFVLKKKEERSHLHRNSTDEFVTVGKRDSTDGITMPEPVHLKSFSEPPSDEENFVCSGYITPAIEDLVEGIHIIVPLEILDTTRDDDLPVEMVNPDHYLDIINPTRNDMAPLFKSEAQIMLSDTCNNNEAKGCLVRIITLSTKDIKKFRKVRN